MKKYITELIGTFFLVLTIIMTVNNPAIGLFAPIAIGAILMVMIYAGGHISGAHYNPAVSVAALLRGKLSAADLPGYIVAQLLGAVLAAFAGKAMLPAVTTEAITMGGGFDFMKAFLPEFLGTFALIYVILNVATSKGTEGNSYFGLAIGFTVAACAYAIGGYTGGAFNPSVATGVSTAGMTPWSNIWMFLVPQLLAAVVAAGVFKATDSHNAE